MKLATTQDIKDVFGNISPPPPLEPFTKTAGAAGLSLFFSKIIELLYVVAALIFVFMIIFSALQWILSGGDKEKVGTARSRLTYAIIGIVLLALAFVIIRVIGQITGFEFFAGQNIENIPPSYLDQFGEP